jgi:phenylalanyl-tRNA synthetase beta chain
MFDLSRVGGREIRVRRAAPSESLTTLDGVERALGPDMLVIADATRPVALAGILGGADSEIGTSTRDVLIEAAYFLPRSIRRTARRLGLSTDASHRFERGADPDAVLAAQEMAVRLLVEMAGGEPAPGLIDAHPRPVIREEVPLRPDRVGRLLGFDPGREAITAALAANGLALRDGEGGTIVVRPPSWRVDLQREADLVEEVARHLGYDKIPEVVGTASPSPRDRSRRTAEERCRTLLAHLGFHEAFNYAMIAVDEDLPFVPLGASAPLKISNPIAETLARLRRSLMPGLVRSAGLNLRRGIADVRLFEIGHVFLRRDQGGFPEERTRAAFAWAGAGSPRHWSARASEADWPGACGIVDAVMRALRPDFPIVRIPSGLEGLHPGRSAAWNSPDGTALAWCGELHPDLAHASDLRARVLLGEVDLDRLLLDPETAARHAPVPRVPSVTRDLSLILGAGAAWSSVIDVLSAVPPPAPVRFEAQDRYEGEPLEPGEVSVTVRVILQPLEQTLTDVETEAYRNDLVGFLASRLQIRLRS